MSADEDTELRDLVAQSLENNGVLGKIRAQLRASVFLALEQESRHSKIPIVNSELKDYITTKEGIMVASLVREFLEFFDLDFSIAVFEPESGFFKDKYEGRHKLSMGLHITETEKSTKRPLLAEILKRLAAGNGDFHEDSSHNTSRDSPTSVFKDITVEQITEVRKKFDKYDHLHRGVVSKDEVRKVFVELFPAFRKVLLERFVEDELDNLDKAYNDKINFNEFLTIYKTLYYQCRSVVTSTGDICEIKPEEINSKVSGFALNKNAKLEEKRIKHDKPSLTKQNSSQHFEDLFDMGADDPFFDDPLPSQAKTRSVVNGTGEQKQNDQFQDKREPKLESKSGGSYLTTLGDLPSFSNKTVNLGRENKSSSLLDDLTKTLNSVHPSNKKVSNTIENNIDGYSHDADYDDDFQSSGSHHSGGKSELKSGKSEPKSGSGHSFEEEINEEIEDFSLEVDDLLNDSPRGLDDLTTDRTMSPPSGVGFDYMEDVKIQYTAGI